MKRYIASVAKFEDGTVDSPFVMELNEDYHNLVSGMVPQIHHTVHEAANQPGVWTWSEYDGGNGRVRVGFNVFEIPELPPIL